MPGTVKIIPEELRAAATYMDGEKSQIIEHVANLKSKVEEIDDNMEGQASTAFLEGFNEMYPMLSQNFPQVIEGICTQLNTIAQVMEEADQQLQQALRG